MSLQPIQFGTLASSEQVNDNFEYLDGRITDTAATITTIEGNLQSQIQTVGNNAANKTLSNVTSLSDEIKELLATKDLSNVTSLSDAFLNVLKPVASNASAPDWDNKVNKSWNTEYTADKNGYVLAKSNARNENPGAYLTINGLSIQIIGVAGAIDVSSIVVPISTGDTYKATGGFSQELYFIPTKGGN